MTTPRGFGTQTEQDTAAATKDIYDSSSNPYTKQIAPSKDVTKLTAFYSEKAASGILSKEEAEALTNIQADAVINPTRSILDSILNEEPVPNITNPEIRSTLETRATSKLPKIHVPVFKPPVLQDTEMAHISDDEEEERDDEERQADRDLDEIDDFLNNQPSSTISTQLNPTPDIPAPPNNPVDKVMIQPLDPEDLLSTFGEELGGHTGVIGPTISVSQAPSVHMNPQETDQYIQQTISDEQNTIAIYIQQLMDIQQNTILEAIATMQTTVMKELQSVGQSVADLNKRVGNLDTNVFTIQTDISALNARFQHSITLMQNQILESTASVEKRPASPMYSQAETEFATQLKIEQIEEDEKLIHKLFALLSDPNGYNAVCEIVKTSPKEGADWLSYPESIRVQFLMKAYKVLIKNKTMTTVDTTQATKHLSQMHYELCSVLRQLP